MRDALASPRVEFDDFLSLISPESINHLEELAARAQRLTRERFGRVVTLYAPLYVSNHCSNSCVYCGFNVENRIQRRTLDQREIEAEARSLWEQGFRHLLLVSGESRKEVPVEMLAQTAKNLHSLFPSLSVEVYPLDVDGYKSLVDVGVEGLTIYQETYDPVIYAKVHPGGPKSDYQRRLRAPEQGGEAGFRRIGIGALLGLTDWRYEAVCLALHAMWLQKTFWRTHISISVPRLREAAGGFAPAHPVSDRELVQMICALRLLLPDAGVVLSTRESATFRDGLAPIAVTMMSAGSCTEPGGYTEPGSAEEQFSIEDSRTPAEVALMLERLGLEPVWKDWDVGYLQDDGRDGGEVQG